MIELKIEITARQCYPTQVSARVDTDGDMEKWEAEEIIRICRQLMTRIEEMFEYDGETDRLKEKKDIEDT